MGAIDFLYGSCIVSVFLVNFINIVQSVPPEYCLHSLNISDCGGPPTPVAYYYKSGSRCEVAIWRGCPTRNKFRDEVVCSHICIAKLLQWSSEEKSMENYEPNSAAVDEEVIREIDIWEQELNLVSREEIQTIDEMLKELEHVIKPQIVKLHFGIVDSTTEPVPSTETTKENTKDKTSEEKVTETVAPATNATTESVTEEATTTTSKATETTTEEWEPGDADEVITT